MNRMNAYYYEREEMHAAGVASTFARSESIQAKVKLNGDV